MIQLPEVGVEGSSASGMGEGRGAHPGNCELLPGNSLCSAAPPRTPHSSRLNCDITCAVSGLWIQQKPGRCFSSPSLFLALPPAGFPGRKFPYETGWRTGQEQQQPFGRTSDTSQQCHTLGGLNRGLKHTKMQENLGRAGEFGKRSKEQRGDT